MKYERLKIRDFVRGGEFLTVNIFSDTKSMPKVIDN
jgi:hypothetical protein